MLALIFAGLIGLSVATPATAQGPFDDWREPVVVELELAGALNGERPRELRRGRIELGPRESFTVQVDPYDQRGRRFQTDRFQTRVGLDAVVVGARWCSTSMGTSTLSMCLNSM